jgi:energy-coupling factor transport system ATP-binding protein
MPIVLENVSHTYMPGSAMAQIALSDISLRVEEGEFLGVIGHTGSGKSTLIQHMNGLMQPSSGRVLVDGLDLSDRKQRMQARSRVGLVFQYPEYQLFEETVYKDVAFGPRNLGVPETEIRERVEEALAGGPDVRAIHLAETLSGDATVAHATAYCQVLEALAGCPASARAQALRALAAAIP